jgi:hypothetical protein
MVNALKHLFSDEPGVSFGRLSSLLWSCAVIGWVSIIVWRTNGVADFKGLEYMPLWFYVGGKGLAKLADIASRIKGKFGAGGATPEVKRCQDGRS